MYCQNKILLDNIDTRWKFKLTECGD